MVAFSESICPTTESFILEILNFSLSTSGMSCLRLRSLSIYVHSPVNSELISSTKPYVAAAIASLLASTSPSELAGRSIGLRELAPTGADIQAALSKRHGSPAKIAHARDEDSIQNIKNQHPFSLMDLVKLKWSRGEHSVGNDIFEVTGYQKATLENLIVDKILGVYRDVPMPYNLDHYFA